MRRVPQKPTQQIDPVGVERGSDVLPLFASPLRELRFVFRKRRDGGPRVIVGRAEDAKDAKQLVDLGVAREQRRLVDHLGEYAPDGPRVDGRGVVPGAEQNLGRAVPQRDHLMRVRADGDPERAR